MSADRPVDRKSASHGESGHARSANDAYFTEPWVTRSLLAAVDFSAYRTSRRLSVIWEPSCGAGHMAREIEATVVSSDIADWGYGYSGVDFLDNDALARLLGGPARAVDAIVTNPPFDQAVKFALRALALTKPSRGKVALLQRHEWDAAAERRELFEQRPFAAKWILPRRPHWIIPPADVPPSPEAAARAAIPVNPKTGKPDSPRFPYAWYLWDWAHSGPPVLRYLSDPDKAQPAVGALL